MPRKITLNSASGGAAASSDSGLTTSEVNTLIDAKILSQGSWKGDWEHVETIQKTGTITSSTVIYTFDFSSMEQGERLHYKLRFVDWTASTATWWRFYMYYTENGSQGSTNLSWRYSGQAGSSNNQSTYNTNYLYFPFSQNILYGGSKQNSGPPVEWEIDIIRDEYDYFKCAITTTCWPSNSSGAHQKYYWNAYIYQTGLENFFWRPDTTIEPSYSANGTGPLIEVYKKPSYTITSS